MNAIITILARGGSRRIPNKALATVCGRPLIDWTVTHAIQYSEGKHQVVVSSDSPVILDHVAKSPGGYPVGYHSRRQEHATDDCPKMAAIADVVREWGRIFGCTFDAVIDLDVCNPMRRVGDIERAVALYYRHTPDSVVSATPARRSPHFNMVEEAGEWVRLPTRSRDHSPLWDLNCCIYVYSPEFLASATHPVGAHTVVCPMPPHTFCDIDHPLDLTIVSHLMKEYGYA